MKKNYFIVIMMLLSLMVITNCKKETNKPSDNGNTNELITLDQLNGTWNFKSFEYNNVVYTNCSELSSVNDLLHVETINATFQTNLGVSNNEIINSYSIDGLCSGGHATGTFTYNNNQLVFYGNNIILEVKSFNATNNTLILSVVKADQTWSYKVYSIYTLVKQ